MKEEAVMKRSKRLVVLAGAMVACVGISMEDLPPVGSEQIVDRSADDRPEWTTVRPVDGDDYTYFVGAEAGFKDYAYAVNQAELQAWGDLSQSILAEFNQFLAGSAVAVGKFAAASSGRAFKGDSARASSIRTKSRSASPFT